MKSVNLSRWALEHKSLVVYLMVVIALAGVMEYRKLGREEDPPFTIKTMVVKTFWPGATTLETVQQVTDASRISSRSWRTSTISRATLSLANPLSW